MSHFDDRHKKYGQLPRTCCGLNVPHSGIDIDVSVGTPVVAGASGVVTDIWDDIMQHEAGVFMVIYHGEDVDGKHVFSFYAHLSQRLKELGDRVERGEVIALSGSTGTRFPHLHLSLFRTVAGPGPEFKQFLRRAWLRGDRAAILADPGMYWADPKRPGVDPNKHYPDRPIRLTYPVPCRKVD
jgi:murein DD-endopeptidase MepM/ murein hydrolase activator NlpD